MRVTVTLARQLGCGGSYLGQRLAEVLRMRCLDREIVSRTAQQLELDEAECAAREEKGASFWERMISGLSGGTPEAPYIPPLLPSISDQQLFAHETGVMRTIAAEEDCIIVGRAAAHVLPVHAGTTNILVYAPLEFRVARVIEFYGAADATQARAMIDRSDSMRGRFIQQMTGSIWDDAKNYHLCVDTSSLPLPEIADFLTEFVRYRTAIASGRPSP